MVFVELAQAVRRIIANPLPLINQAIEISQILWVLSVEKRPDIPDFRCRPVRVGSSQP